jgi:hypothetical protein
MTKPQKLSPGEQEELNNRLRLVAKKGDTKTVQELLAAGADVHAKHDWALCGAADLGHTETVKVLLAGGGEVHALTDNALRWAAQNGHTETVKVLLTAGANVHAQDDCALRWAASGGHTETVKILAKHLFAPEVWRGKSRAAIEAYATTLYNKINAGNHQSERLLTAAKILADCAIDCWQEVRPAPPKIQISPIPAQSRPL